MSLVDGSRGAAALTPLVHFLLQLLFSSLLLMFPTSFSCSNGACQVLESCVAATDCGPGLYCGNCPALGKNQPFCTRGQATMPTSIIGGLPFNKYTWLVTHNSFSIVDAPSLPGVQRMTFYNQEDTVTNQLRNGVRGLMLDMYDFEGDIWLCHSFRGQCFNFTAFMPKKGEDWPTVTEMVQDNHRLLVFTSDASKEAEQGVAYQWKYLVENESGDPGVVHGSCPNRKESKPLNSRSPSLFLMNYFPTYPVQADACKEHSTPLTEMVGTCFKAAGHVMPNFLAVNFYMRSDGGGVFDALDRMNGQLMCGCSTVAACQAGAPYGSCKNISLPPRSPVTNPAGSFSGFVQFTNSAFSVHPQDYFWALIFFALLMAYFP
ncbi:hypothetical protein SAY86_031527 [Trapa natans]|uniref:PI-PLC X domain-containing protein n=1 Tax=Trapa natans TaxID=22666 RepID=A0AAN7LUD7_TRANT|nr:hypothetical protein SAY86_031527 [Trapa natans]